MGVIFLRQGHLIHHQRWSPVPLWGRHRFNTLTPFHYPPGGSLSHKHILRLSFVCFIIIGRAFFEPRDYRVVFVLQEKAMPTTGQKKRRCPRTRQRKGDAHALSKGKGDAYHRAKEKAMPTHRPLVYLQILKESF